MNDTLYVGRTPLRDDTQAPGGDFVSLQGETYYRISHVDQMPPFLMSVVSSGDHWLFIASNGGLTAGRRNADRALFPYETEDKLIAHRDHNGPRTLLRISRAGRTQLWEPFSDRFAGLYQCDRHLYKNVAGNKLLLEEINHDLGLAFRTAWRSGDRFGFVRTSRLLNQGDAAVEVTVLDGLQNVLPAGATTQLQTNLSSLLNAYKRSELHPATGLGIFALSATLTDGAEPSEALRANTVWQTGLDAAGHLLSTVQIDAFRRGAAPATEHDVRGQAGAYMVFSHFALQPGAQRRWHFVADVHQDTATVNRLLGTLGQDEAMLEAALEEDIAQGTAALRRRVAAADGLQITARAIMAPHHFANVLFNIMRGGVFTDGYQRRHGGSAPICARCATAVLANDAALFAALPPRLSIDDLYDRAAAIADAQLERLCFEYLPLTFSRRHGDPSRPWNRFSINLTTADGSPWLDYQGNWRDIFQNWEPLALAYPQLPARHDCQISQRHHRRRLQSVSRHSRRHRMGGCRNRTTPGPISATGTITRSSICRSCSNWPQRRSPASRRRSGAAHLRLANVPYRLRPYDRHARRLVLQHHLRLGAGGLIEARVARDGTDGRLLQDGAGRVRSCDHGRKAPRAAPGQADQPGARRGHLVEHPAAGME